VGISVPGQIHGAEIRAIVDEYREAILAALPLHAANPGAFDDAIDEGLAQIARLERETASLDEAAAARAADALRVVADANSRSALVLGAVVLAASLGGLALVALALRVLRELRMLSAAERAAAAETREALRVRNDFIADASHELRTPLTVLRGNAQLGLAMDAVDCGHPPVLREILAEAARMTRLVEELLFLARHDAGSQTIELKEVELERLVADIAARAEVLARGRHVPLETSLEVVGRGRLDADRVERAVMVLIDNASRLGPPGVPVSLVARTEDGDLMIEVSDRGPGIAPDLRPQIFERFWRGDRSRRGQTGAGLGLSIARAVVEAHGGTIAAADRQGGGTRMIMRLPLASPATPPGPGTGNPSPARSR
jgi:signal transduction histidine kinase